MKLFSIELNFYFVIFVKLFIRLYLYKTFFVLWSTILWSW